MPTNDEMRSSFLRDIIAHPECDDRRLIFADWLSDQGEDDRAEFIRCKIRAARAAPGDAAAWEFNLATGWEILRKSPVREWFDLPSEDKWTVFVRSSFKVELYDPESDQTIQIVTRRGFVDEVHCPMQAWLDHGKQIARSQPVETVRITDRKPYRFDDRFAECFGWAGQGALMAPVHARLPQEVYDAMDCIGTETSLQDAWGRLSRGCIRWARS